MTERRRLVQPVWTALADALAIAPTGTGVLLAVSGGHDSAVLLEAAARWPGRDRLRLEVGSVDHGHRPAASGEADGVVARARAVGFEASVLLGRTALPPQAPPGPVGGATGEARLRQARYQVLVEHAAQRGHALLVTAHHADDDAEGLLLHLLGRGGGRGGAAMTVSRPEGPVRLVRPFLALRRTDLALAATGLGLSGRLLDAADARGAGERAEVRASALPALRQIRPGIDVRLARLARRLADDEAALAYAAERTIAAQVTTQDGQRRVTLTAGATVPAALWRRAVTEQLRGLTPRDPRRGSRTLDALSAAAASGHPGRYDLTGVRASVLASPPDAPDRREVVLETAES